MNDQCPGLIRDTERVLKFVHTNNIKLLKIIGFTVSW